MCKTYTNRPTLFKTYRPNTLGFCITYTSSQRMCTTHTYIPSCVNNMHWKPWPCAQRTWTTMCKTYTNRPTLFKTYRPNTLGFCITYTSSQRMCTTHTYIPSCVNNMHWKPWPCAQRTCTCTPTAFALYTAYTNIPCLEHNVQQQLVLCTTDILSEVLAVCTTYTDSPSHMHNGPILRKRTPIISYCVNVQQAPTYMQNVNQYHMVSIFNHYCLRTVCALCIWYIYVIIYWQIARCIDIHNVTLWQTESKVCLVCFIVSVLEAVFHFLAIILQVRFHNIWYYSCNELLLDRCRFWCMDKSNHKYHGTLCLVWLVYLKATCYYTISSLDIILGRQTPVNMA